MNKNYLRTLCSLALCAGVIPLAACVGMSPTEAIAQSPPPPTLKIHADQKGIEISPELYGVFFEEINHSGDGGLYAEMIRNRDFEETPGKASGVPGWTLSAATASPGKLTLEIENPYSPNNPHSLKASGLSSGDSIQNEGYWGVSIKKQARYRLSFNVRTSTASSNQKISVRLKGKSGTVFAESVQSGFSEKWKHVQVELAAKGDDPEALLELSPNGIKTLWLDNVSLFPVDTFKKRENGLRLDLASHVNSLKPAFVRFPGGCYVEGGDRIANAFRWFNTIGDAGARPGHLNDIWGYRSTDGLGYDEYLRWTEDMKAEPLFVVNCGMSHKDFVPKAEIQPWIDEALGAIEYANGPVTSKWGALRAKNGHPASYNLKFVEIGNENGLFGEQFGGSKAQYTERYKLFYDAIKTKYPYIKTVANTRVPYEMEIVDDHYYNSPAWFWSSIGLYDNYDRKGPKVYVGEYAVTSDCGQGNLKAALGEAAFMTGMERNSDAVVMSSYAPLFVNVRDRKWNPNAIVFDGARSFGTPSFWVQKLFSENRPDVMIPSNIPDLSSKVSQGTIGLGTWRTSAEFKNVEVTQNGKQVYASDFDKGASEWKPVRGAWKAVDGVYRQTEETERVRALLNIPQLNEAQDYTVSLKARKLSGVEGFLILFRTKDDQNWMWWNIAGWQNRETGIESSIGGSTIAIGGRHADSVEIGKWYDVKIELQGSSIKCYLNGKLVQTETERALPTFTAIAGRRLKSNEIIVKVVNGSNDARTVTLDIEGTSGLLAKGVATEMTSGSLEDENALNDPLRISPKTSAFNCPGLIFPYTFKPRSLTILKLREKL